MIYKVLAHWDAAASVWWAESADVTGLAAEADTLEALIADLRDIVPELLALNQGGDVPDDVQIAVVADRTESLLPA